MCISAPPKPKAPMPLAVLPPPEVPILDIKDPTKTAQAASRGRSSLRIDRTQSLPGATGAGLTIPS